MNDSSCVIDCAYVIKKWLTDAEEKQRIWNELVDHLQPHRGFRGIQDFSRFTARLGDVGVKYVYAGKQHKLAQFTPTLAILRDKLTTDLRTQFNCCYVNLYIDGNSSLPRHSDITSLPQLGPEPVIVSVSLGSSRVFQFWDAKEPKNVNKMRSVLLEDGDVCVMHGRSQIDWLHAVPKMPSETEPRLSITFRHHSDCLYK